MTVSIKNWERFQHYKDRDPPWIKLYRDLLTSESWVLGTDVSRVVQIAITLLAARYENQIPHRFSLIRKVASLDCSESQFNKALEHLAQSNFLEIQSLPSEAEVVAQPASGLLATCTSEAEQSRAEQRQSRDRSLSSVKPLDRVVEVFDHWRTVWNHPSAQLDIKRRTSINRALKVYEADKLCESISGYRNSPHHCGQNDRQTVYDDIGLFLRDAGHIDAGIRFGRDPPAITSALAQHNVSVLSNWKAPENADEIAGHREVSSLDGDYVGGIRKAALPAAR